MHMADALLSPAVGGTMWVVTGTAIGYCARRLRNSLDDAKLPLMGVLGAFVFAAQMINFTIPGTGSSGHLGGGLLLAILLGPHAAFLVMGSILTIQALFFADGGLLALGGNIFNLGFFPCFIAYPLVYQQLAGRSNSRKRIAAAALISVAVALQLGSFSVVVETVFSGISDLPFRTFLLFMQPIHLAIGLVEGLVTALVVNFIRQADPAILLEKDAMRNGSGRMRKVLAGFGLMTVLVGGFLSWFASSSPDGLEWSVAKITGAEELHSPEQGVHGLLDTWQRKIALFPDYGLKPSAKHAPAAGRNSWPAAEAGTTLAGLVGGFMTLALVGLLGLLLKKRYRVT